MTSFFIKLGMGILGELAIRLMDPKMVVDQIIIPIAKKLSEKTETDIDDLIVKAFEKK